MQGLDVEYVDPILCYLIGVSEVYQIVEFTKANTLVERTMVATLETMCPLSTQICTVVEASQMIKTYRHICKTKSLIFNNVRLEGSRTRFVPPLTRSHKYQCAFRGCNKEAGIWIPWHPGRGVQHLPLESYDGSVACVGDSSSSSPQVLISDFAATQKRNSAQHVVVTCSWKCYCRVTAYLSGLGGQMFFHIYVVRGTRRAPQELKRELKAEVDRREAENGFGWRPKPGEYDGLIDALDFELHIFPRKRSDRKLCVLGNTNED